MEKYDIAIIGAGPGGYPAAIRAAQLGLSPALIEREMLGGTCLNWGCIPTKSLIHSSAQFWNIKHGTHPGIITGDVAPDYPAMAKRKDVIVEKLRDGVSRLLKANGVAVIEGSAVFAGRNRISITAKSNETTIEAANIIIATGCVSAPPFPLPKSKAIVDSRSFLNLTSLPSSMVIVGGGIIGCEFACMAAQLGTSVTIVEMLPDILQTLDADVRALARHYMEQTLKIRIITGKLLENLSAGNGGVSAQAGDERIEAELLLVATGRRPAATDLRIETAGVATNAKGFIQTDENCRTSAATVYAVGDVTGGHQLAHLAMAQGLMTAERIAGHARWGGVGLVPACIFTTPEIAFVGLSEQDAMSQKKSVLTGKFPFTASGKAMAEDATVGFVKWVADASNGQLLGAQAIGSHATELIAEAVLAIRFELTATELGRTIHSHPTLSEAWMEAAHAVHGQCIHAPPLKKTHEKTRERAREE